MMYFRVFGGKMRSFVNKGVCYWSVICGDFGLFYGWMRKKLAADLR